MNIENINERLLRTERERDEARAEVEKIKAREAEGVALFDSLLARECEMSFRVDLDEIISIAKTAGSDCPTPLWILEAAAEYLPKKRDALIAKTKAAFDALAGRGGAK